MSQTLHLGFDKTNTYIVVVVSDDDGRQTCFLPFDKWREMVAEIEAEISSIEMRNVQQV